MDGLMAPRSATCTPVGPLGPKEDGGPLYLVRRTFNDPYNRIQLGFGSVVQTECMGWVKRMGSAFEPISVLPPRTDLNSVHLVTDCREDRDPDDDGTIPVTVPAQRVVIERSAFVPPTLK